MYITSAINGAITAAVGNNASFTPTSVQGLLMWHNENGISEVQNNVTFNTPAALSGIATTTTSQADGLGGTSGVLFAEDATAGGHYFYCGQTFSFTSGATITLTLYLKSNGRDVVLIEGAGMSFYFNISTRAVVSGSSQPTSISCSDGANGYVKVVMTKTNATTNLSQLTFYMADNSPNYIYTGDGSSGMYVSNVSATYTVSGKVGKWLDQSGNNNHFYNLLQNAGPDYSTSDSDFNGKPSITFNGVNTNITAADVTFDDFTLFLVHTPASNSGYLWSRLEGPATYDTLYSDSSSSYYTGRGAYVSASNVNGRWLKGNITQGCQVLRRRFSERSDNFVYINGVKCHNIETTNQDPSGSATGDITLSGTPGTGLMCNYKVAEVILYNRKLTDLECSQVEAYLYNKYNMKAQAPSVFSDLAAWYDADTGITLSGSNVTQWNDLSGNGNHLVSDGGYDPEYITNSSSFGNAVRFSEAGATRLKSTSTFDFSTGQTYFIVYKLDSMKNYQGLMRFGTDYVAGNSINIYSNSSEQLIWYGNQTSFFYLDISLSQSYTTYGSGVAQMLSCSVTDGVTNTKRLWVNRSEIGTFGGDVGTWSTYPTGFYYFAGGGYGSGSSVMDGEIAEIIVYDRQLDLNEHEAVLKYLAAKHNITDDGHA